MKVKPTILIFIDWYLPGYKAGGPIQSCANLVEHLKEEANFYIVTRNTDYCSDKPYSSVTSDEWNEQNGAQVYYISRYQLNIQTLRRLLKGVDPDTIYINGVYSLFFSILPVLLAKKLNNKHVVIAARGMFAGSAINVKGLKKKMFFGLAKITNLYKGVTFHATNSAEEGDIKAVLGHVTPVHVAPNLSEVLVDTPALPEKRLKARGEVKLVSIARISPEKNTKYALEVLREYKGQEKVKLDLFGPVYNKEYWEECCAVIEEMPANVSVDYKGSLEKEKVHQVLQQNHALFMPTKGENFGHIILESLTAGCPVIISDQTPWKKLEAAGVGYDLSLKNKDGFKDAIQFLAGLDQERYDNLSDKAVAYAQTYIQNSSNVEANKALFNL
ncbi:glycosyltransferase family 4 protein [Pontibacter locisalis]|uniref:Glycosyltransferase family 4 protein n=1 Tax=Pontibacter locisalis TaxID=1719035 RepID=A0ABW5IRI2_9BACT